MTRPVPRRRSTEPAKVFKEKPPYELTYSPDGRSWTARENLGDILERELLGPAGGAEEILDGSPDAAYLVGRIAPVKLTAGGDDPTQEGEVDAATDVGDAMDAEQSRGVPLTAVDDSTVESDEDTAEDAPPKRGLMIPASMGLRFQIPTGLASFVVHSSWGVYNPIGGDDPERRGRRYQRTPVARDIAVQVRDLRPGHTRTIPLVDEIVLRIDVYDDAERERLLVDVALCNDKETPRRIPVNAWLYQTKLTVDAGGSAVFLPVTDTLTDTRREEDDELRRLNLQYRDKLEFAIGRTCSVGWGRVDPDTRRTATVWTTWLPVVETPQTTAAEIAEAELDMQVLALADRDALEAGLQPIVDGYRTWPDEQADGARALPDHLREDADELVHEARQVADQLAAGVEHLLADDEALRCFRFMNRVMADQRVQTQVAELRAAQPEMSIAVARSSIIDTVRSPHSWRTFQLAFVLMQLPLLTDPAAEARSGATAKAQLLFFPTGGGKTEAYLGLAAYTFAIRRRQGVVDTDDGGVDGHSGVAVLMRYTLRLLTAQQFQRATALVCAAEMARRDDVDTWGQEPFRIGLWVGTDVSPKRFDEAAAQLGKVSEGRAHRLTVLQIQRCPWCGTRIGPGQVKAVTAKRRVYVYCGDEFGACPFARQGDDGGEGLPILTVDEEIYRLVPAFVIATVDKFARLAREGEAASLFGRVSRQCDRHGYVHPDYSKCDLTEGGKHPARDGQPTASVRPARRLRPPDLIIQDELHLIAGALGTTVGLFEVVIDVVSSWRTGEGVPVRPLVVASSATVRNAPDQVRALYGRDLTVFPPQVLEAGSTFFSAELPISDRASGRRYVGISTTGVRLTTAEIRVTEILMGAAQLLLDRTGDAADPYLTLVGYFNATRELAGMSRYLSDDVQTALRKGRPWSRLPRRFGTGYGNLNTGELTGRVSSSEIGTTLDRMAVGFDPAHDSTEAFQRRVDGHPSPSRETTPYDAILATSMLQVGVDVTRLGLMLMVGQPKNTAEYIQASSRVGRSSDRPGLVVTLDNWARPRDLAHFEQFRHYHETFYARVEALSVTPFSWTSMQRGLDGVLISAARVLQADRRDGVSQETGAGRVDTERAALEAVIEALVARVHRASDEDARDRASRQLRNRLDHWSLRRGHLARLRQQLVYDRISTTNKGKQGPLLMSPENAKAYPDARDVPPFVVANSMREVQPEINLLVSPAPERLFMGEPPGSPQWKLPPEESA